jgi:hypothetical protein
MKICTESARMLTYSLRAKAGVVHRVNKHETLHPWVLHRDIKHAAMHSNVSQPKTAGSMFSQQIID